MPAQGAKLKVKMKGKGSGTYEPIVTDFNAPFYFRWRAKMIAGYLITNCKIFELKETNNQTTLVHKETFSGVLVALFWRKMEKFVPGMLDSMNKALKNRVENSGNASSR